MFCLRVLFLQCLGFYCLPSNQHTYMQCSTAYIFIYGSLLPTNQVKTINHIESGRCTSAQAFLCRSEGIFYEDLHCSCLRAIKILLALFSDLFMQRTVNWGFCESAHKSPALPLASSSSSYIPKRAISLHNVYKVCKGNFRATISQNELSPIGKLLFKLVLLYTFKFG